MSRHHGWYAAQVSHGTTYAVLTLSLLIRPVWPSTYEELVSLSQKRKPLLLKMKSFLHSSFSSSCHRNYCCYFEWKIVRN